MAGPALKKQRGIALISVLLVMALAVTLVTWLVSRQWLDMRRTGNLVNGRQAHYYALAAEVYARQVLAADLRDNSVDNQSEFWARPAQPLEIEQGALAVQVSDLLGRFNVNNLIDQAGRLRSDELERFKRLLSALNLPQRYAAELQDWLDRDQRTSESGAEDVDYGGRITAAGWISDVDELRQLKSMRAQDFERLAPHLTALPGETRINVNTASVSVLQSLSPAMSASRAQGLAARQRAGGWETVGDFLDEAGLSGDGVASNLSVSSDYFQVAAEARYDRQRAQLTSILHRSRGTRGVVIDVIGRQQRLAQPLASKDNE